MRGEKIETPSKIRFIDLFCGIGGFHLGVGRAAAQKGVEAECVFSSDIDKKCQEAYAGNFGRRPLGDITKVSEKEIPNHDLLLAGFPCQPFSILGHKKGFEDTRGTLFFDIARILKEKRPSAFILENVKLLVNHNHGQTLKRILQTLRELGYHVDYRVLNALDFGLPQKRERVFIVGFSDPDAFSRFEWCEGNMPMKPLAKILEKNVPAKYFASDKIRTSRWSKLTPTKEPTIWHENKAGHISAYPFSCALRAGASYNYLLVNGERRLTPREMLRLQGFPESFKIICKDHQTRKQAGNSVPVNLVEAVAQRVFAAQGWTRVNGKHLELEAVEPKYRRTEAAERRKVSAALPS